MFTTQHVNTPTKTCRAIRAAGPKSPALAYTNLPDFEGEPALECHDWQATAPLPPSDDGFWLSLFGLASAWSDAG